MLLGCDVCDEAYEAYVNKCAFFGVKPSSRDNLERNEEVVDVVHEGKGRYILVTKAKELVTRAYDMGYKEAMREIAS